MSPKYRRAPADLAVLAASCGTNIGCRAGISMRELDPKSPPEVPACAVIGAGRLGTVLAAALSTRPRAAPRGAGPAGAEVVLLCVPDGKIAEAAAAVAARAAARPLLRRDRPRRLRRPRGLLPAPADVRPDRRASRACCAARAPRSTGRASARWPSRARSPARSGCAPRGSRPRTASPTTPRARSRPTSSSRSRPAPSGSRPRPGSPARSSRRSCSRPPSSGRELGPEAALTGAIARGDEGTVGAPPRRDRRADAGAAAGLDRAGRGHARRGG